MSSIFSKIIAGHIPSYKIVESDFCYAFLDISPLKQGHTLVVPKTEVDQLFDLNSEAYLELMKFSKAVAKAIQTVVPCKRISMHVIGLEVPHAHVHLIPINTMNDCNFSNQKLTLSQPEFEAIASKISKAFLANASN